MAVKVCTIVMLMRASCVASCGFDHFGITLDGSGVFIKNMKYAVMKDDRITDSGDVPPALQGTGFYGSPMEFGADGKPYFIKKDGSLAWMSMDTEWQRRDNGGTLPPALRNAGFANFDDYSIAPTGAAGEPVFIKGNRYVKLSGDSQRVVDGPGNLPGFIASAGFGTFDHVSITLTGEGVFLKGNTYMVTNNGWSTVIDQGTLPQTLLSNQVCAGGGSSAGSSAGMGGGGGSSSGASSSGGSSSGASSSGASSSGGSSSGGGSSAGFGGGGSGSGSPGTASKSSRPLSFLAVHLIGLAGATMLFG